MLFKQLLSIAVSLEADAGLVEDLRSGKSNVKTVSQVAMNKSISEAHS
jgi:hypothetical protein